MNTTSDELVEMYVEWEQIMGDEYHSWYLDDQYQYYYDNERNQ